MNMLITGATRGLGRALVDYYTPTYNVRGCARSTRTDYQCDITDEQSIQDMLRPKGGPWNIDVLINCAGIASMNHLLLTPTETIVDILNTNLLGTILMCREVGKKMVKQKGGRIINVSTIAVPLALAGEAVYVASKAGVEAFTRALAKELGDRNITVNCVAPTVVEDNMGRIMGLSAEVPKDKIDELLWRTAINEACTVEDIAKVIDLFIRDDMVTGQVIYLGGV